ncbi:MAG: TIGR02266 family protein [Sandaracinaceae bacterium]
MHASAIPVENDDEVRVGRRAAELIRSACEVLKTEIAEDGAMARAIDRVARVARSLMVEQTDHGFDTAIKSTHEALSHALSIGRAVRDALEPRGQQCIDSLAAAQRLLYPLAQTRGVVAVPPPEEEKIFNIERRSSPRVETHVEVSFESETNFFQGFSEDISDGGLFIATYQMQPLGTVMEVEFTLPTGHIVRAEAEVRWHRQLRSEAEGVSPGMGLRFIELRPEDARAIAQFIHARSPLFYDE